MISQVMITRGVITASQHVEITAGSQSGNDIGRSVVTKVNTGAGQKAAAGQVLIEISGRPLFILPGKVPAYRDLSSGKRGDDVKQLQLALRDSGYATGADHSGFFGPGTQAAVASFYRAIGYETPTIEVSTPLTEKESKPGEPQPPTEEREPPSRIPVVPMSEVIFVESFPAYVDEMRVKVGAETSSGLLSLSSGALTVEGAVTPQEKGMVRAGQQVEIYSELAGRHFKGKVASVSKEAVQVKDGSQQPGSEKYTVKVTPSQKLPTNLNGENVQLTIVAASSGNKVLAVPSSAISTGADGLTSVTERVGAAEHRIPVNVGVSGDGFVQVTPQNGFRLEPGVNVVVGVQRRSPDDRPQR